MTFTKMAKAGYLSRRLDDLLAKEKAANAQEARKAKAKTAKTRLLGDQEARTARKTMVDALTKKRTTGPRKPRTKKQGEKNEDEGEDYHLSKDWMKWLDTFQMPVRGSDRDDQLGLLHAHAKSQLHTYAQDLKEISQSSITEYTTRYLATLQRRLQQQQDASLGTALRRKFRISQRVNRANAAITLMSIRPQHYGEMIARAHGTMRGREIDLTAKRHFIDETGFALDDKAYSIVLPRRVRTMEYFHEVMHDDHKGMLLRVQNQYAIELWKKKFMSKIAPDGQVNSELDIKERPLHQIDVVDVYKYVHDEPLGPQALGRWTKYFERQTSLKRYALGVTMNLCAYLHRDYREKQEIETVKKHLEVESKKTFTKTAFSKGLDPIAMHATLLNAHITDILKSNKKGGNGSPSMSAVDSLDNIGSLKSADLDFFNNKNKGGPTNKNGRARPA